MLFNSHLFILAFLPVTLSVYFLLNKRGKFLYGKLWLVLSSLVFYAYFNLAYLPIIVISILGNYGLSQCMLTTPKAWLRKLCLAFGLTVNLGVLVYYKYYDFFAANLNAALGSDLVLLKLVLPLGISFFTFQQLSYVIDSYAREVPRYSLPDYALFVTFFPQLIAGPIVLHSEIVPQFADPANRHFQPDNFALGLYAFARGLAKKVLVADTFAKVAAYGYTAANVRLNGAEALLVVLAYTLQIYFDFSGYCDMALGLGKMFNIHIPINFSSPYKALSIKDFWARWHMTLGRFFSRYVYLPLGGSRKGSLRTCVNLLVVFLVSGLWHGAGWMFLLWGALHGVASLVYRLCRHRYDKLHPALRWVLTFFFVALTWVFFCAGSSGLPAAEQLQAALNVLTSLFTKAPGPLAPALIAPFAFPFGLLHEPAPMLMGVWFTGAMVSVLALRNTYEMAAAFRPTLWKGLLTVGLIGLCLLSLSGISVFLYYNF